MRWKKAVLPTEGGKTAASGSITNGEKWTCSRHSTIGRMAEFLAEDEMFESCHVARHSNGRHRHSFR